MLAEGMKNHGAANGEDADGSEGEDLGDFGLELQQIGEERRERTEDAERIQPYGCADRADLVAIAQAKLHQDSGESDGGDHHDRERTVEGAARGEDDDEGEGSAEQARSDDGPAAGW